MTVSSLLAKHLRDVHFGGNWTSVNLKEQLAGVSWQQATVQIDGFNTIAKLVHHIHYFVDTVRKVLEGGPLDAHDKFSFDHPPIGSKEEWLRFLEKVWATAEACAAAIERSPDERLADDLPGKKYGNYHRNILGIIEHSHYHLGQIVILKKLL